MKRDLLHRRRTGWLQRWHLLQALRTEGRGLVTGMLVACIVLFLVGIAMQLPPPAPLLHLTALRKFPIVP